MNIVDRLKSAFGPKEVMQERTASSTGPAIHVHMPSTGGSRKVPGFAVALAALVVLIGLVWAGRKTAKVVETPLATTPTPTPLDSIRGFNRPNLLAQPPVDMAQKAQQEYDAKMAALDQANKKASESGNGGRDIYGNPTQTQAGGGSAPQLTPAQQAAVDRLKRDEESLTASSVIHIPEVPEPAHDSEREASSAATNQPVPVKTDVAVMDKTRKDCVDVVESGVTHYAICEGSILPTILDNRLEGEFAGPVKAFIRQDVYASDGQHLLIPRGTVALGDAKKVDRANQKRMEVEFHRLILPGGRGLVLEKMIGLDQAGETALSGKLNRHLLSTFGTAAMIGGLGALAQSSGGSVYTSGGFEAYKSSAASQMGQQGQTVLQQGLNRPPEIRISEGKILSIYVTQDLHLPEFVPEMQTKLKERVK